MEYDYQKFEQLLKHPEESYNTELKAWLDPELPEHKTKIIKACIALYNEDGGHLLIGYNNDGTADKNNPPDNLKEKYHTDKIQSLVSKYLSKKIEVKVIFHPTEGFSERVIIFMPSGVSTPICTKSEIKIMRTKSYYLYIRCMFVLSTQIIL